MSPEDIARRHEEMAGYQLVDYAEVGLPIWQISIDAISLAHRRLPPISEFILRCISEGLSEEDIGGFLGLQPDVTRGAIATLMSERVIRATFDGESEEASGVALTEEGEKMLREDGATVPIEEQIPVFFDGLHRRPTLVPAEQIAYPRDAESGRLVEIAAMPATKPVVSELSIDDLQALLANQAGGRGEFGRDLLRLKRISRYRRLFRLGVALVFKGVKNSKDLRVKFIVGGVRAEDLERRFADQGGLSRPGFVKSFSDGYLNANLRRHLGQDVAAAVLDAREYEARQRRLSVARLKASAVERKLLMVRDGELSLREGPTREEAERVRAELRAANEAILQPGARPAAVHEHPEFLETALKAARTSCAISSLGLSPFFISPRFLDELEKRLKAGLAIQIRLHRSTAEKQAKSKDLARYYSELEKMSRKFASLTLSHVEEDRYFHVICDERIALVSNRPFLSNYARTRTFEQFSGYFIQETSLVRRYLDRVGAAS